MSGPLRAEGNASGSAPPGTESGAEESAPGTPAFWESRRPAAPDTSKVRGIRFATTNDFPPLNFSDEDGRLAGFNIDLAELICEQLEVPCTVRAFDWSALPGAMAARRYDALIAGLRYTGRTRDTYLFSEPYLMLPARFAVSRTGTAPEKISPQTLAGKKIGVIDGTAHAAFITRFFPDAGVLKFERLSGAYDALRIGVIDTLFADGMTLSIWLNGGGLANCCRLAGGPYLHPRYFGTGLRIAVRPDRPDLKEAIDFALDRVYGSGRYTELYLRYFPISFF